MTVQYRTKGFVFKKEDRSEADRIFSVFTQDLGRTEIFAKAIRKITSKLKGGIEIFSLSEIEFIQGKTYKTLTDAVAIEKFNHIPENPEKIAISYNISRLLDVFIKGQESDQRIWDLITDFFKKLDGQEVTDRYQLLYYYFFWNFISVLGHGPELYQCSHCNQKLNPYHLYFSHKEGGVVCKSCFGVNIDSKKINSDIVKTLRLMLKNDWDTVIKLKLPLYSQQLLENISYNYGNYLAQNYSFSTLHNMTQEL